MPDINISVKNKIALQTDKTEYICGNSDFVAKFDFDNEWDAYDTKTARFCYNGKYIDVIFTGDSCAVPIINNANDIDIGVYAGNLHTTTPALVLCEKSILCDSGFPSNPSDDVYNQIMEKLNSLEGVDPKVVQKAVADYLKDNPVTESDPTVSAWAKAKAKPTYTAKEVGAIAETDLQVAIDSALTQAKASGEFDGTPGKDGKDGTNGKDGSPGKDGSDGTSVTVTSVTESTEDGGDNVITFSDGTSVTIKNGSKGSTGAKGDKGDTGATGAAGHTPEKGIDYWTASDKLGIVDDVLASLPTWAGGNY